MGNICCGPRNEAKVRTDVLNQALNDKFLNKESFEKSNIFESHQNTIESRQHTNESKKESIIKSKSLHQLKTKEERKLTFEDIDEDSSILTLIEKVKTSSYIKDSIIKYQTNSEEYIKNTNPSKGSEYNTSELKRDAIKECLLVVDQELIIKQKGVIGHIMKQFSMNLLQGKSIMNISFPVQVFEPRSVLERLANTFKYAPNFLQKAGNTFDSLEQFKLVISFFISGLHLNISQRKPFNPILGETFQGFIGNTSVFLEQVCHHPPISYFLVFFDKIVKSH